MMFRKIIPIGVAILGAGLIAPSALAQQQPSGVQGALQGLLSGNQSQDQAVRDAYERGYQRGRQDEARMARSTGTTPPTRTTEAPTAPDPDTTGITGRTIWGRTTTDSCRVAAHIRRAWPKRLGAEPIPLVRFHDHGEKIGSIDDAILSKASSADKVILSVGGILGAGAKLASVPYSDLRLGDTKHASSDNKLVMPGATQESAKATPEFYYTDRS